MGRVLARSSGKKGQGWRPPQGCGVWGGERRREGVARQKGRGAPPLARTGSSPLPTQAEGGGRPLVGCTHRRAGRVVGRQPTENCSCICSYRFYPRSAVAPLARVSHGYPRHHQPRVRSNTVQEDYATLHCYQSPACLTTCRRSRRSPTGVMPAREPARTPAQSLSPPGGDRCDPGRPGGGERGQGRWRRVTSVGGGECGRLGAGSAGNGERSGQSYPFYVPFGRFPRPRPLSPSPPHSHPVAASTPRDIMSGSVPRTMSSQRRAGGG